jgi:hypothetical protein
VCKFAVINFSCIIVSVGRKFGCCEMANKSPDSSSRNLGFPFSLRLVPRYAFESARIISILCAVPSVLQTRTLAKIRFSVVECIVILVITLFVWLAAENCPVHQDSFSSFHSLGVETLRILAPERAPIKLRKPLKIFGVNNGILPLRKRDQTVGLIKRLGHCVTFHAGFEHLSSLKGRLLPAAF